MTIGLFGLFSLRCIKIKRIYASIIANFQVVQLPCCHICCIIACIYSTSSYMCSCSFGTTTSKATMYSYCSTSCKCRRCYASSCYIVSLGRINSTTSYSCPCSTSIIACGTISAYSFCCSCARYAYSACYSSSCYCGSS